MLWFGHLAFGYLTSLMFLFLFGTDFSESQLRLITLVVIFSAIIPDFDIIYSYFKFKSLRYQKGTSHRNWISHSPICYLIIGILIFFIFNFSFYSFLGLAFIFGSFSHFIADSVQYGVMWLYPFSKKRYSLITPKKDSFLFYEKTNSFFKYYWNLLTKVYMKGANFYIEVIVIALALALFFT